MKTRKLAVITSITVLSLLAALLLPMKCAESGSFDYKGVSRDGKRVLDSAIGFTLDPDTFLFAPGIDFYLSNLISLGPNIQLGVSDNIILMTAAANAKFTFDIRTDDFWNRFKPSMQFGAGLLLSNYDLPANNSDTDVAVVFNIGLGFDIFLNDKLSLGNHMLFNMLTPPADEHFLFSWHFLTCKYYF